MEQITIIISLLQQLRHLTTAQDTPQAFQGLCRAIYELRQHFDKEVTYFCPDTEQNYKFDDLMREYGLEKTQTSRLLSSYARYFDQDKIKPAFAEFSKCKLFELLTVPTSMLEPDVECGRVTAHSTVREIRKYVKQHKPKKDQANGSANTETDESDIEPVYNPAQQYPFSYFEQKTKAQLLNMVWELQKFTYKKRGAR